MRIYETTFIVNPQMEEATIDRQVKAVAEIITRNGGKIIQENHLGTRRLAYEIKGLTQGFYGGFIFESANAALAPLDRHYKLNEAYLRHLTVCFEGDLASLQEEKATESQQAAAPEPAAAAPVAQRRPEATETESVEPKPESAPVEPEQEPLPEVKAQSEEPAAPAPEPEQPESAPDDSEEML
jgi:small subunit ribosomal protein S6